LHIKDLRIIANRDLKDVILVDNFMYSYSFQFENGVPILPYFGGKEDDELEHLAKLLEKVAQIDESIDLREVVSSIFRSEMIDKFGQR
jgi:CTD small phosphatase-like protein 2